MTRVGMVVFSYCPADPRVQREVKAMADVGMTVDVVCLRGPNQSKRDTVYGLRINRLLLEQECGGKIRYLWEYAAFTLLAFLLVSCLHLRKRYRLVHVDIMPDILVFSVLLPRLTGNAGENTMVNCTTLGDVLSSKGLDRVDLLKINGEGAEYEILYTADDQILEKPQEIRMEYHSEDSVRNGVCGLRAFLESQGIDITHLFGNSAEDIFIWARRIR